MAESVYQTNKTKTKFRPFKTDENEKATYTIAAMYFALIVFPFLLWRFKARESGVFKLT